MLGDGAMIKMAQSKVFLSGLGGLGVEIGKLYVNAKAQAHYTVVTKGLFYFLADEYLCIQMYIHELV